MTCSCCHFSPAKMGGASKILESTFGRSCHVDCIADTALSGQKLRLFPLACHLILRPVAFHARTSGPSQSLQEKGHVLLSFPFWFPRPLSPNTHSCHSSCGRASALNISTIILSPSLYHRPDYPNRYISPNGSVLSYLRLAPVVLEHFPSWGPCGKPPLPLSNPPTLMTAVRSSPCPLAKLGT